MIFSLGSAYGRDHMNNVISDRFRASAVTIDGDSDKQSRDFAKISANVLLSNPDMYVTENPSLSTALYMLCCRTQ
jgi:hypothetical protein